MPYDLELATIFGSGGTVLFWPAAYGPPPGSGYQLVNSYFVPMGMNSKGWAIGYDKINGAEVWTGTRADATPLAPMSKPVAIDNIGDVVGTDDSGNGDLWTSGSGTTPISKVLPAQYQGAVSNITPIDVSGTNANGPIRILFNAYYQTDSNNDWAWGNLLLTLVSGSSTLQQVFMPPKITHWTFDALNAQGVISGLVASGDLKGWAGTDEPMG